MAQALEKCPWCKASLRGIRPWQGQMACPECAKSWNVAYEVQLAEEKRNRRKSIPLEPEPDQLSEGLDRLLDDGDRRKRPRGATQVIRADCILGGILSAVWLLTFLAIGLLDWAIVQTATFLFVVFSSRSKLRRGVLRHVDRVLEYCERRPRPKNMDQWPVARLPIPFLFGFSSWGLSKMYEWRIRGALLGVALFGLPVDIGLQLLTTYVLPLPSWGLVEVLNNVPDAGGRVIGMILINAFLGLMLAMWANPIFFKFAADLRLLRRIKSKAAASPSSSAAP